MTLPSRYGSSEYSAEAEELFAEYVRRSGAGEELDFEAYCRTHPELADELDGLHADWDNLHGLLGRMGVLDAAQARSAQRSLPTAGPAGPFGDGPFGDEPFGEAERSSPAEGRREESGTPARDPVQPAPPRSLPRGPALALVLVALGAAAAAASMGWVARAEARAAGRMADHNRRLTGEVLERDERLVELEAARLQAAEQAAALAARADEEARRAEGALARAEAEARRATEQAGLVEEIRRRAEEEALEALEQARLAAEEARRVEELERERGLQRRRAGAALVALAAERLERGDAPGSRLALAQVEGDLRGFAWQHLEARLEDAPRIAFEGPSGELQPHFAAASHARGGVARLAVFGPDGLELLDLEQGRRVGGDHLELRGVLGAALDGPGGQVLVAHVAAGRIELVFLALEPPRAGASKPGSSAPPRAARSVELTSYPTELTGIPSLLGAGAGRWVILTQGSPPLLASVAGLRELPDPGAPMTASAVAPERDTLVVGLSDGRVLSLHLDELGAAPATSQGTPHGFLELARSPAGIRGLALDPGGRRLVLVDARGSLRALDLEAGTELWTARALPDALPALSADGLLAARTALDTVAVWRLEDGLPLGAARQAGVAATGLGWTRAGELAVSRADGRVLVGEPGGGDAPLVLARGSLASLGLPVPVPAALRDEGEGIPPELQPPPAQASNGECRAEAHADGRWLLRDVESGAVLWAERRSPALTALAFSADGRHLVASDGAGATLVWTLDPSWVRAARTRPAAPDR